MTSSLIVQKECKVWFFALKWCQDHGLERDFIVNIVVKLLGLFLNIGKKTVVLLVGIMNKFVFKSIGIIIQKFCQ